MAIMMKTKQRGTDLKSATNAAIKIAHKKLIRYLYLSVILNILFIIGLIVKLKS